MRSNTFCLQKKLRQPYTKEEKDKQTKKRKIVNSIDNKHHHQQKVTFIKFIKSMKSTGFANILTDRRGLTQRTLVQKGKKFMQSFGREEET